MNTHNTSRFRPVMLALAMGVLALPLSARALLLTTEQSSSIRTNANLSVNDKDAGTVPVTSENSSAGTFSGSSFNTFNSAHGVLTRVVTTLTTVGTLEKARQNNSNAQGSASLNVSSWVAFGSTAISDVVASNTAALSVEKNASAKSTTFNTLSQDLALADSFVGDGTQILGGSSSVAYTVTANKDSGDTGKHITASYTRPAESGNNATQTLQYEYLLHAAPSFDGLSQQLTLNLDFGPFFVDETASLGFDLFNLSGDRVGVDLDSVVGSGDAGVLRTDLGLFSALSAGLSRSYTALLDTSSAGIFSAIYQLNFSDADVGAAASRWTYQLTLNLTGTVREREGGGVLDTGDVLPVAQNSVPEPASLALLGLGLFGLGAMRRRARA